MSVRVRTYVRPSVRLSVQACKSEVIYRWIFFPSSSPPSLPGLSSPVSFFSASSPVARPPRPSRIRSCPFRTAQNPPVKSEEERPFLFFSFLTFFFYFFIPRTTVRFFAPSRESIRREGARAGETFFSFRAVDARECVAGVNQSTSPGIRLYGTPEAWMTSRDGARCARTKMQKCALFFSTRTSTNHYHLL